MLLCMYTLKPLIQEKPLLAEKLFIRCSCCILDLAHGLNGFGNDNCKTRPETFKFCDLMRFILEA